MSNPENPAGSATAPERGPERELAKGRVVLDAAGIQRATTRIAHEILESHPDVSELVVVAIVRGGEPVAKLVTARLEELSTRTIPLGALDITLYRDDVVARGVRPMPRPTRMPFSVDGKRVGGPDNNSGTTITTNATNMAAPVRRCFSCVSKQQL